MENNKYDAQIKLYLEKGGKLFSINNINTIRDGGTKYISTTNGDLYIHFINYTIHTAYPPKPDNEINDVLFKSLVLDRIEKYINRFEFDIEMNKNLLQNLIDKQ